MMFFGALERLKDLSGDVFHFLMSVHIGPERYCANMKATSADLTEGMVSNAKYPSFSVAVIKAKDATTEQRLQCAHRDARSNILGWIKNSKKFEFPSIKKMNDLIPYLTVIPTNQSESQIESDIEKFTNINVTPYNLFHYRDPCAVVQDG